jgi:signal transduction histidine kinase
MSERVVIRIRDNGVGIPPDVKEKMFNSSQQNLPEKGPG